MQYVQVSVDQRRESSSSPSLRRGVTVDGVVVLGLNREQVNCLKTVDHCNRYKNCTFNLRQRLCQNIFPKPKRRFREEDYLI